MVICGSLGFEAAGALILTLWFWPQYGFVRALRWGVFHSISAFCNAGFDIFGSMEPGSSLLLFQNDPVVLLTLGTLVDVYKRQALKILFSCGINIAYFGALVK